MRKEAGKYIQRLTHLPKRVERGIEEGLRDAKHEASQLMAEAGDQLHRAEDALSRRDKTSTSQLDDNERDDDWHDVDDEEHDNDADTEEGGDLSSSPLGRQVLSTVKKRSLSPKHKSTQRPVFSQSRASAGKRRESFRRGVLRARSQVQSPLKSQGTFPEDSSATGIEDKQQHEQQRGRSPSSRETPRSRLTTPATRLGTSGTHTPHRDSFSRLRYDTLRAASPSRSVRFADEQAGVASGSQTPVLRPDTSSGDGTPPSGTPSGSNSVQ